MAPDHELDSLRDFFTFCQEMLFIADRGGALLKLSGGFARLLGPEAREGTALAALVHPDDRGSFDAGFRRLSESTDPVEVSFRIRRADGEHQRVVCQARRAPARGEIHGSLREDDPGGDVTVARLFRAFWDNIPIVVWAVDRKGIFTIHAGKGLEESGIVPGEHIGKSVFELYGDSADSSVRPSLAGETTHTFGDAHDIGWESWTVPLRDGRGEILGVGGITINLSDARRAEKELKEKLALIDRQQRVIRELSMPIIEVWDKVLTLPMLGVVDSTRAADMMENLLNEISRKGARFAVLDLTGVDTVDTGTAGHLLKLISAIRLLGAEGIITGIQPGVAQTMVTLGFDLQHTVTLASLRAGLQHCMTKMRETTAAPDAGR